MGMSASQARLLSLTARMNDVEFKSQNIANIKIRLADESEQLAMKYTKAISQQKYTFTTYASGQAQKVDLTLANLSQIGSKYRLMTKDGKVVVSSLEKGIMDHALCYGYNMNVDNDGVEKAELSSKNHFIYYSLQKSGVTSLTLDAYNENYGNDLVTKGVATKAQVDYYTDLFNEMFAASSTKSNNHKSYDGYEVLPGADKSDPAWLYNAIESGEFMLVDISSGKEVTASNSVALAIETDSSEFAKAEAEYNAANMKINNKEKLLDNELKKLDTEHNALSTEMDSIKNLIGKNIEKSFNLFS